MSTLTDRLAARIRRDGPLPFSAFVDAALYDERDGFYATRGGAGRRSDFLTSVEVGPLFGAVIARALDAWWDDLGRPDPFRVAECGAGRGTLARGVLAASPRCLPALRYVLVERSARLRAEQPVGAPFESLATLPEAAAPGVVLANELLDNLAFDLLERLDDGWAEVRVGLDSHGRLTETFVATGGPAIEAAPGARVPVQREAQAWLARALESAEPGRVVVIDYVATSARLASRPWREWLRTYRAHERGRGPLDDAGLQDITCDVAVDQLAAVRPPDAHRSQAEFLGAHGIDALVEEGRRLWAERASVGDLAALRARSRVREAEALCDPSGLGAHGVLEWQTA